MAIKFDHKPESGSWNLAKGEGVHEYNLIGTAGEFPDEVAASAFLVNTVPLFFQGAWLQDIQIKPQGNGLYYVSCPYGPLPKWPGSYQFEFDSTGGTVHISSSRSMVAKYGANAPNTVIIGQDGAGAEITVPVQMRTYTFNFASGIVTEAAADYWEKLTGVVNSVPWRGRPEGEVLFLGARGSSTISADSNSTVSFRFAMALNKTGFSIGGIANIDKQGHDLIDIHTKSQVVGGQEVQTEKFVYIQRVYDRLNFATYLGF